MYALYDLAMAWEVEMTEQAEAWFLGLDQRDRRRVAEAVDALVVGVHRWGVPSSTASRARVIAT
jgi:hypothetical protein